MPAVPNTTPLSRVSYRVGIDIGGTFTDIVATGSDGQVFVRKTSSTPDDYSVGSARGVKFTP